jgi:hypothetical protein
MFADLFLDVARIARRLGLRWLSRRFVDLSIWAG